MSGATRFLMLGLVGLSFGCAHMTPALPERVSWVKPGLGEATQISIGDAVLSAGNALQIRVIAVPHPVVVAGYQIPSADYPVVSISENGAEFRAQLQPGQAVPTGGQKVANALFGEPSDGFC